MVCEFCTESSSEPARLFLISSGIPFVNQFRVVSLVLLSKTVTAIEILPSGSLATLFLPE